MIYSMKQEGGRNLYITYTTSFDVTSIKEIISFEPYSLLTPLCIIYILKPFSCQVQKSLCSYAKGKTIVYYFDFSCWNRGFAIIENI
jgi:hypothetical protein